MIHFLTHVFNQPQCHSIYWDIENARAGEWVLGQPVAYCYITRDANCVMYDMARWVLEAQATITLGWAVALECPKKLATRFL